MFCGMTGVADSAGRDVGVNGTVDGVPDFDSGFWLQRQGRQPLYLLPVRGRGSGDVESEDLEQRESIECRVFQQWVAKQTSEVDGAFDQFRIDPIWRHGAGVSRGDQNRGFDASVVLGAVSSPGEESLSRSFTGRLDEHAGPAVDLLCGSGP
jgi:hypothetical protein